MALRTPLSVTPHLYMGDSTGRPLDKGVVYFGEQDKDPEFYPIDLFSDDALTKPLAQPVHTKGGYLYDKGDMVEPHAKEFIYSVKVLDSYGRKVFYKGAMMRNSWNDDVIQQINQAIVDSQQDVAAAAASAVQDAINNTAVEGGVLADTFVTKTTNGIGQVARTQRDKNSDIINVNDFGAVGDWNDKAKTGTDNTEAFARVIEYIASTGAANEGGMRQVFIPQGSYYLDHIKLPRSLLGWGVNFTGVSGGSSLYFNPNTEEDAAIDCEIEALYFRGLKLDGGTGDRSRGSVGLRAAKGDGQLDIDITFIDCHISRWNIFADVYGRGIGFKNCGLTSSSCALRIGAPESPKIPSTSGGYDQGTIDSIWSLETGMRHYDIHNCRTDGVHDLIRLNHVSSDDARKLMYNVGNISICNNGHIGLTHYIRAEDPKNGIEPTKFRIKNLMVSGNQIIQGIYNSIIEGVDSLYNFSFVGNNVLSYANVDDPDKAGPRGIRSNIGCVAKISGQYRNVNISSNNIVGISTYVIGSSSKTEEHSNILISGNTFDEYAAYVVSTNYVQVLSSPDAPCNGLVIHNNVFYRSKHAKNATRPSYTSASQPRYLTDISGNTSNFNFIDTVASYTPKALFGSVEVDLERGDGFYEKVNGKIRGYFYIRLTLDSGQITSLGNTPLHITLPTKTSVKKYLSSSYLTGDARLVFTTGLAESIELDATMSPTPDLRLHLRKKGGSSPVAGDSQLKASDLSAGVATDFECSFEYTYTTQNS